MSAEFIAVVHSDEDVELVLQLVDGLRRGPGLAGHHSHTCPHLCTGVVQAEHRVVVSRVLRALLRTHQRMRYRGRHQLGITRCFVARDRTHGFGGYGRLLQGLAAHRGGLVDRPSVLGPNVTDGRRTRHLVGRADWEGRVCSEIVKFDTQDLRATTKSGRVYKLEGPPGRDLDAEYVFGIWLQGTGYTQEKDMTKALMRLRGLRK